MTRFNNLRTLGILLASAAAVSLGACSTMPGPYNGLGSDPMSMLIVHDNIDYPPVTAAGYTVIVAHANDCFEEKKQQMASVGETVGSMGVTGAVSGGIGGAGVTKIIPGATMGVYVPYVGTLNGVANANAGLGVQSSAAVSYVGSCVNADLNMPRTKAKVGQGITVLPSFVRSKNRSDAPPPWITPNSKVAPYQSNADSAESGQQTPIPPPPNSR